MALSVHLEGTTLEGGGQLLRIALGVSALTAIPIETTNIRGKRSGGGGLKAQHLSSVIWLGKACRARISGAGLKSKNLEFTPSTGGSSSSVLDYYERQLPDGTTVLETQITQSTPGSIGLVFQAILPFLLFSGSTIDHDQDPSPRPKPIRIRITGGTNVSMSPSYDYISQVLLPTLSLIGLPPITAAVHSRGWSHGRANIGSVTFTIQPLTPKSHLPSFTLSNRGAISSINATILAPKSTESHFRDELAVMLSKRHSEIFGSDRDGEDIDIDITFEDSGHEKRFYLLLVATSSHGHKLGRDWLYDHGIRAGKIDVVVSSLVKKVVGDLVREIRHGGCVDEFLRDQLVVFQALARGRNCVDAGWEGNGVEVEPSLHARTAEWVCGEVLGVEFDGKGGCVGVGLRAGEVYAERFGKGGKGDGGEELVEAVERLEI